MLGLGDVELRNFAVLRPRRAATNLDIRLPHSQERVEQLEQAGLDVLDYDTRWGAYRVRLGAGDVDKYSAILATFLKEAYDARGA